MHTNIFDDVQNVSNKSSSGLSRNVLAQFVLPIIRLFLLFPHPTCNTSRTAALKCGGQILFSWRTSKAQLNHSRLQKYKQFSWECSWITSMWVCFEQKSFLLAGTIFQVFSSKSLNAFVKRDKRKFARSFFPFFFCSSVIVKSSISLLILFSTINFDTSKLDNLRGFFFLLFC